MSTVPHESPPAAPLPPGQPVGVAPATEDDLQDIEIAPLQAVALSRTPVWAKPKVASALGVVASVLVHVLIIGLGVALIPALRPYVAKLAVQQEQTIVPVAELATEKLGSIPNPGMTDRRSTAAGQAVERSVQQSSAWGDQKRASLDRSLMSGGGKEAPLQSGVGATKAGAKGLGEGVAGGGLAKFGVPGGGAGIGPQGAVFGNGGNAYRIVFICDGTGTMLDKLPLLQRELRYTINKLKPKQQYDVIFFYDGANAKAVDPTKLVPALPGNNKKAFDFIDAFAVSGHTNPIPAIEMAFRLRPELVYFLSDGAFNDLAPYDEVVATFAKLNADKKVRVNTIIFTNKTERTEELRLAGDVMKRIAAANGGTSVAKDPKELMTQ